MNYATDFFIYIVSVVTFFLTSLITVNAQEQVEVIEVESIINEADMPIHRMEQVIFAYEAYKKRFDYNESCLRILVGKTGNTITVGFGAKREPIIDGDTITITTGGNSECGRAITYFFDENGKYVKWAYPK